MVLLLEVDLVHKDLLVEQVEVLVEHFMVVVEVLHYKPHQQYKLQQKVNYG